MNLLGRLPQRRVTVVLAAVVSTQGARVMSPPAERPLEARGTPRRARCFVGGEALLCSANPLHFVFNVQTALLHLKGHHHHHSSEH